MVLKKIFSLLFLFTSLAYSQILDINSSGWKLLGATATLTPINTFNNSCIQSIWRYKNGSWKAYSPNQTIATAMQSFNYLDTNLTVSAGEGFWINTSSSCHIDSNQTTLPNLFSGKRIQTHQLYFWEFYDGFNMAEFNIADPKTPLNSGTYTLKSTNEMSIVWEDNAISNVLFSPNLQLNATVQITGSWEQNLTVLNIEDLNISSLHFSSEMLQDKKFYMIERYSDNNETYLNSINFLSASSLVWSEYEPTCLATKGLDSSCAYESTLTYTLNNGEIQFGENFNLKLVNTTSDYLEANATNQDGNSFMRLYEDTTKALQYYNTLQNITQPIIDNTIPTITNVTYNSVPDSYGGYTIQFDLNVESNIYYLILNSSDIAVTSAKVINNHDYSIPGAGYFSSYILSVGTQTLLNGRFSIGVYPSDVYDKSGKYDVYIVARSSSDPSKYSITPTKITLGF